MSFLRSEKFLLNEMKGVAECNGAEFKSLLCLSKLCGDQEIVANGFCRTKWSKKSRRVKITFLGGLFVFDARDLVAQEL